MHCVTVARVMRLSVIITSRFEKENVILFRDEFYFLLCIDSWKHRVTCKSETQNFTCNPMLSWVSELQKKNRIRGLNIKRHVLILQPSRIVTFIQRRLNVDSSTLSRRRVNVMCLLIILHQGYLTKVVFVSRADFGIHTVRLPGEWELSCTTAAHRQPLHL